jgi:hypothetical protein
VFCCALNTTFHSDLVIAPRGLICLLALILPSSPTRPIRRKSGVRNGDPQLFEQILLGGRVPFVDRAQSVQFP